MTDFKNNLGDNHFGTLVKEIRLLWILIKITCLKIDYIKRCYVLGGWVSAFFIGSYFITEAIFIFNRQEVRGSMLHITVILRIMYYSLLINCINYIMISEILFVNICRQQSTI